MWGVNRQVIRGVCVLVGPALQPYLHSAPCGEGVLPWGSGCLLATDTTGFIEPRRQPLLQNLPRWSQSQPGVITSQLPNCFSSFFQKLTSKKIQFFLFSRLQYVYLPCKHDYNLVVRENKKNWSKLSHYVMKVS